MAQPFLAVLGQRIALAYGHSESLLRERHRSPPLFHSEPRPYVPILSYHCRSARFSDTLPPAANRVPPFVGALKRLLKGGLLPTDRRITTRRRLKTSLRVRLWDSSSPEHFAESVNLSERGILFLTSAAFAKGSRVEVFLRMPRELTGRHHLEWRCTGRVVRVEPSLNEKNSVAVAFYRTELLPGNINPLRASLAGLPLQSGKA